jgi:hypothetical protein
MLLVLKDEGLFIFRAMAFVSLARITPGSLVVISYRQPASVCFRCGFARYEEEPIH